MTNRLAREKSPYLLQHRENPVEWYPWGEEAFQKARQEDKPVFLSIGYSTCHWCHVMAHESFEDKEVAEILNHDYISIKVDREERPDIDAVYMSVCQTFTGSGGWPLTIFLTPEQKPFFAGTYFPKQGRYGQLGLIALVKCAPFTQDYPIPETGAVYYLCENGACKAPVKSLSQLERILDSKVHGDPASTITQKDRGRTHE